MIIENKVFVLVWGGKNRKWVIFLVGVNNLGIILIKSFVKNLIIINNYWFVGSILFLGRNGLDWNLSI